MAEREWDKAERLLNDAVQAAPQAVAPVIVRAELVLARDPTKVAEARAILQEARKRFPKEKSIDLWNAEANVISELWNAQTGSIGKQRKVDEALAFLDQAQRQLGDQVELRLERARLLAAKMGPQAVPALIELAQNTNAFSKDGRRNLLSGLAEELVRQRNLEGANRLWSQVAADNPDDIKLRTILTDLAFQLGNKDEIEKNIAQIARIEGSEGIQSRFLRVRYLIWQITRTGDPKTQQELRIEARALLSGLRANRPDWSVIPRTLAGLDEQELNQTGLDEKQKKEKLESVISSYIEAIDLGQRDSATILHVVELLFAHGKAEEVLALFSRLPVRLQLAGDLGPRYPKLRSTIKTSSGPRQSCGKMVAANPGSFKDRVWLVQILQARGEPAAAEQELRNAVELSKDDPDRWIAMIRWYIVSIKQLEKAEQTMQQAEKNLPEAKAPMALGQCCELMAQAYETANDGATKAKWYGEAEKWYEKDRASHPDDLPVARRLTDFFIRTKQLQKVSSLLNAILKGGAGKDSDMTVWARRTLALTLASGTDPKGLKEALTLVEPQDQTGETGAKATQDPEDLRILTQVLELEGTPEHRAARSSFYNHWLPRILPQLRIGSGWLDSWMPAVIGQELKSSTASSSCKPTIAWT